MMIKRNIQKSSILVLLPLIIACSCSSLKKQKTPEIVVTPLSDTVIMRPGSLIYALPMTVFKLTFQFERTIELPGPYAKFAGDLLGLTNVITQEDEHWEVRSISVSSHEEIDPSEYYVIGSNSLQQTNALALKKSGLILDLNPESDKPGLTGYDGNDFNINDFRTYDLGSDEYFRVQTDTAYRRASIDDQFIRIPYVVEKIKKFSPEELAERAAKRLMELREGKFMVLTGEANVFPQNEAAINELNRMEQEYSELFTGKVISEIRSFTYQLIPTLGMSGKPLCLFNFSEVTGPASDTTSSGIPVIIELSPEKKTKDITIISTQHGDPAASKTDRLYYRVPDVAVLKIKMGDEVLHNSRKLVYQLGQIVQLPANYIIGK